MTGRTVDNLSLERIEITTIGSLGKEFMIQTHLHFADKPAGIADKVG
jgi:hypothetical protein